MKTLDGVCVRKELESYEGKFIHILEKFKAIIRTKNYKFKDESLKEYFRLYKNYLMFLDRNKGKIGERNKVKNSINKLIEIIDGKKVWVVMTEEFFSYRKEMNNILEKLCKVIVEKNYEEKDRIIKYYDYLKFNYGKFFEERKDKINSNIELKGKFYEIDKEIRDKIALLAVFKDLAWKRVKFDNFLGSFKDLKGKFNKRLFYSNYNKYREKVLEYEKCLDSYNNTINGDYYLRELKLDILDITKKIDNEIQELCKNYNINLKK